MSPASRQRPKESENSVRKLYFVRHGQTYWNVENKICGATDSPLTPLGHEQAVRTGKMLLEEGIRFDQIICSPLSRAFETARHISEITGVPVRIDERLKEQNFGKYESTPRDGEEFLLAKENFADPYGNGESMLHLAQRVYNLLDEIKADPQGRDILLVAHNGIARVVESYFRPMSNREYARFTIRNCAVQTYHWDDAEGHNTARPDDVADRHNTAGADDVADRHNTAGSDDAAEGHNTAAAGESETRGSKHSGAAVRKDVAEPPLDVHVRAWTPQDLPDMIRIWNEVVEEGIAFPQEDDLDEVSGKAFFSAQTHTAVAETDGHIVGLYILHPNNIGRCGHIGNASYAVLSGCRGMHIGEALVKDCLEKAKECGFSLLQFNAVVESNTHARHLYERLGFCPLGTIPGGFHMKDGHYENICLYYHTL